MDSFNLLSKVIHLFVKNGFVKSSFPLMFCEERINHEIERWIEFLKTRFVEFHVRRMFLQKVVLFINMIQIITNTPIDIDNIIGKIIRNDTGTEPV